MLKNNVTIFEIRKYFEKYRFLKDVSQSDLIFLLNTNIENKAVRQSKYEGLCEGQIYGNLYVLKYIPRIKHNWGVLYLCKCLVCGDLFLVHCEKVISGCYKCCYKKSCIEKSKINKIKISGFTLPQNFTNNDIYELFNFIENKYDNVVYNDFKFLKCIGIEKNKNNNLYIKIQIQCQKCETIRTCAYEFWKKSEISFCEGCNKLEGKVKVSKKDNLALMKKDVTFDLRCKNKVSNKYLYIGKWHISEGVQKIWVQCKDCLCFMLVDINDYLNDFILECYCTGKVKKIKVGKDLDILSHFDGYIHYDDSLKDTIYGMDKILYKIEGQPILAVECQECGKIRNVSEEEFLNERTKYFNFCDCMESKDSDIRVFDRFGHLTVQDIIEDEISLVCDCGNEVKYSIEYFKGSKNRVCSSHCNFPKFSSKYYDKKLIGQRFNDFIIKDLLKRDTFNNPDKAGAHWLCECQKCGSIDSYFASEIYRGNKKSCCFGKKYYTPDYIGKIVNGIEILSVFKVDGSGLGTLWQCKCPYCGDLFVVQPTFVINESIYHCGCQSKTKGELVVDTFLKQLNIEKNCDLYYQYSFKDLKSDKNVRLRYDFALIDKVTKQVYLIEYDGPQHDDINSVIGSKSLEEAKEIFEVTKRHDFLKDKYALRNNYPLLRIKNTKSRKVIEEHILNFLKENNLFRR